MTSPAPAATQRSRRLVALGVGGAVLTFAALVLIPILAIRPFLPADESAHVDYAIQVAHGHLPIAGPILHPEFAGQRPTAQYVSNHPPLYYVIAGPFLRLALAAHHAQAGLLAVRALSILFGAAAIILTAVFAGSFAARTSRRTRSQLMVGAAGLVATLPALISAAAAIQNDALMVGFVGLTLALLGAAVRSGLRTRSMLYLGLSCAGGMLSRATFIGVLLAVLGVIALLSLWPDGFRDRPSALQWRQAISRVVIVGGISAIGAGWYYALNYHRYGDFIGGSVAYDLVKYRPKQPGADSTLHFLLTFGGIKVQIQQLAGGWDSLLGGGQLHRTDVLAMIIGVLICLGIAATAVAVARGARWPDREGAVLALGLAVMLLIAFVSVADHVAHGGGPNNRYLLSALGFWAILGSAALLLGSPRRWPVPVLLLIGLQVIGSINSTLIMVHRIPPLGWHSWFSGIADGMDAANIPAARAILVILLIVVVAGVAAQALALFALGRLPEPVEPEPATV
ncbi:MAG TPA: hypothetical protein VHC49_12625 [Mycobacteriales bacterium]|nr:hypothetical protein [Mycobacteriales bacterium]